jgi:hypothetical protein
MWMGIVAPPNGRTSRRILRMLAIGAGRWLVNGRAAASRAKSFDAASEPSS